MGRGLLDGGQGDWDRDFDDYNQALRLDPSYAPAYSIRGAAHFDRGDYEAAVADYDQALLLDPIEAGIYDARGLSHFYLWRFEKAVADWQWRVLLRPGDRIAVIWLYLARVRAGQNGAVALARNARGFDLGKWPGPVIAMYLGEMTGAAMLNLARMEQTIRSSERRGAALFYLGQQQLVAGDGDWARDLFRRAMDEGSAGSIEYRGAEAELRHLAKE